MDFAWPDVADIHMAGFKSSVGSLRGKGGDFRGIQKSKHRQDVRRYWKKRARREGKVALTEQLED